MKGSSSSTHARWLCGAILTVLILCPALSADGQVVYEKAAERFPSDEKLSSEYRCIEDGDPIWEDDTDDEGRWEICGLPPGIYEVCEVDQEGWTQSYPVNESSGEPVCHVVEIAGSNVSGIDFLNRGDYCLSGHKYWDINQNGWRDTDEKYLSGWMITVVDVADETNRWKTPTNADGYWRVCNLPAGTYRLSESSPGGELGWIASQKPDKVTITNRSIKDLDFGNYRILHDEPRQYEQFCESQLVEGSGYLDTKTSVMDKKLAMNYTNRMFGEGDIGLESAQVYSQEPNKLKRPIPNCSDPSGTTLQKLNFYENTKLEFRGETPLVGSKSIRSIERYGGIGANIHENFSVRRMEADQTMFLGQTSNSTIRRTVGSNTLTSFEGMWGTVSGLHKIFYKDIKRRELFAGEFEVQRELKFHENPVDEPRICPCGGVDC